MIVGRGVIYKEIKSQVTELLRIPYLCNYPGTEIKKYLTFPMVNCFLKRKQNNA